MSLSPPSLDENGEIEAKGFLASLFDFGFTSFVTLKFLKVIYMLVVGLMVLYAAVSEGGGKKGDTTPPRLIRKST